MFVRCVSLPVRMSILNASVSSHFSCMLRSCPEAAAELRQRRARARAANQARVEAAEDILRKGGSLSPLVDWAAVDAELARIHRRAHPRQATSRAVAHVGLATRAAWREALGRMTMAAARLETYRSRVSSGLDEEEEEGVEGVALPTTPPPPPRLNLGVVGGSVAAGVGGKAGRWTFPAVVAATLQKIFPRVAVAIVADGSRAGGGSLTVRCIFPAPPSLRRAWTSVVFCN